MKYHKAVKLKNGAECILRSGTESDAEEVLSNFILTHAETDNMLTYPDEIKFTAELEAKFLKAKEESKNEVLILAEVGGRLAGFAGIDAVGKSFKVSHRAEYGIGLAKEFWGIGIGTALTNACIECAKLAGYEQLELNVISENERAINMYKSAGFIEFGRNPVGFKSRSGVYQELIYMKLNLK